MRMKPPASREALRASCWVLMAAVSIALTSGCTALPLGGKGLEAVIEGRRQEQPQAQVPAEVEPVSCQCNVYCAV
jgi:hypothetical protein